MNDETKTSSTSDSSSTSGSKPDPDIRPDPSFPIPYFPIQTDREKDVRILRHHAQKAARIEYLKEPDEPCEPMQFGSMLSPLSEPVRRRNPHLMPDMILHALTDIPIQLSKAQLLPENLDPTFRDWQLPWVTNGRELHCYIDHPLGSLFPFNPWRITCLHPKPSFSQVLHAGGVVFGFAEAANGTPLRNPEPEKEWKIICKKYEQACGFPPITSSSGLTANNKTPDFSDHSPLRPFATPSLLLPYPVLHYPGDPDFLPIAHYPTPSGGVYIYEHAFVYHPGSGNIARLD